MGFIGAIPARHFYVAIKFPLIILLTTFGKRMAQCDAGRLCSGVEHRFGASRFWQFLMSFTMAIGHSWFLYSPLTAFLIWNSQPLSAAAGDSARDLLCDLQLMHVGDYRFRGHSREILRLIQLLRQLAANATVAPPGVLVAWLAGNLFFRQSTFLDLAFHLLVRPVFAG